MSNPRLTRHIGFLIIGIGFAVGALVHASEGFANLLGYHLRVYPTWRHFLFASLESGLAAVAIRRPKMLWAPLLFLLMQQTTTHGLDVRESWRGGHGPAWLSLGTMIFLTASLILAIHYRLSIRSGGGREGST